ncbi:pinin/SDK/memA/ protein conserved region-domain-containing protein [Cercophora samala]|uniref:Pinin/SDK/memA/ protein conserved region-domain-containing protein n=1 Tax=Cercophora samala TaxID=330535 RepID=A0AA39YZ32_9PEZI|nr:pinin/SDK/memA/ protein conserved region-domain-containing protein [Cercophora samala]
MADYEDFPPRNNKRKASPSPPPPSNASAKRSRVNPDELPDYRDDHHRGPHRRDSIGYDNRPWSPVHQRHPNPYPRRDSHRQPPPIPQEPLAPPPKKSVTQEERKRGQRLFGGILGTLSGQTRESSNLHKRRLDIEKRQHERAQKQEVEDEKHRRGRVERTRRERLIDQIEVDEKSMHARHEDMMEKARSLMTRGYPRILYRPWELTREQERTVRDQVRDAEDRIDRELAEWKREKERRYRELGVSVPAPTRPREDGYRREPARPREEDYPRESARPREDDSRRERDRPQEPAPNSKNDSGEGNLDQQDNLPKDTQMEVDDQPKKEEEIEKDKDSEHKRRSSDQHHDEVMVQDAEDTVIY